MQINEQTRFQQHQQEKQIEKQKMELEQHAGTIKDQVTAEIKSDLKKGNWEFDDSVPKSLREQLDTMHNNYQKEIERIRNDNATENVTNCSKNDQENLNEIKNDYFKDPSDYMKSWPRRNSSFSDKLGFNDISVKQRTKRQSSFLSPGVEGNRWNSRMLFSKTNPSPVAAVKPQPQESNREKEIEMPTQRISENMNGENNSASETRNLRRSQRLLSGRANSSPQNDNEIAESQEYRAASSSKSDSKNNRNMFTKDDPEDDKPWDQRKNLFISRQFEGNLETANTILSHDNKNNLVNKSGDKSRKQIHHTLPTSSVNPLHSKYSNKNSFVSSQNCDNADQQHVNANKKQKATSIFDFDDESIIGQNQTIPFQSYRHRPQQKNTNWKFSSEVQKEDSFWDSLRNPECQSDSRDSSPSLSVTKVLIERKINKPRRTSMSSSGGSDGRNQYSKKVYRQRMTNHHGVNPQSDDSEDFLYQPDMNVFTETVHHWDNKGLGTKISKSTQKRRLCNENNPEMVEVMSTVKHQQKKKRY